MSAAHGAKAVGVGQETGQTRIDLGFVGALVGNDLVRNDVVRFGDQADCRRRLCVIEGIGDLPETVEGIIEALVLLAQRRRGRRWQEPGRAMR